MRKSKQSKARKWNLGTPKFETPMLINWKFVDPNSNIENWEGSETQSSKHSNFRKLNIPRKNENNKTKTRARNYNKYCWKYQNRKSQNLKSELSGTIDNSVGRRWGGINRGGGRNAAFKKMSKDPLQIRLFREPCRKNTMRVLIMQPCRHTQS